MNSSRRIDIVNGSTLDTQKIIHVLFESLRVQQTNLKDLAEGFGAKNLAKIKENSDSLKRQIQYETVLMRGVESILHKQETVLREEGSSNDSGIALEIRALLDSISDQNWSVGILKTMLRSLELRIDGFEKNFLEEVL